MLANAAVLDPEAGSLAEGVQRAQESIDSGAAAGVLDGYLELAR